MSIFTYNIFFIILSMDDNYMKFKNSHLVVLGALIWLSSFTIYAVPKNSTDLFKENPTDNADKPNIFDKEKNMAGKKKPEDSVSINSKKNIQPERVVNGRYIAPNSLEPTLEYKFDDSLHPDNPAYG
jgi:hypothetical protein